MEPQHSSFCQVRIRYSRRQAPLPPTPPTQSPEVNSRQLLTSDVLSNFHETERDIRVIRTQLTHIFAHRGPMSQSINNKHVMVNPN